MMLRRFLDRLARWPRLDAGLFALAMSLFVVSGARVLSGVDRTPVAESSAVEIATWAPVPDALPHIAPEALMAAVFTDPFRADRSAPARRYRLGEQAEPSGARTSDRLPIPRYRLHGTAVSAQLALALIDGSPARRGVQVYRLGDTIDAFRVSVIVGDSVVLTAADTAIVVKILRAWKE